MASSVLIVDDEESIRRSVADILSDEGYAPEAIELDVVDIDIDGRTYRHPYVVLLV